MISFLGLHRYAALSLGLVATIAGCGGKQVYPVPTVGRSLGASWPGSSGVQTVRMGKYEVTVMRQDSAVGLLKAAGVVPNADAIEVLRLLNPEANVFNLTPGTSLNMPSIVGAASSRRPIELVVDEQKKRALVDEIHRAADAARRVQSADLHEASEGIAANLNEIGVRLEKRSLVTTDGLLQVVTLEARSFITVATELARHSASESQRTLVTQLADDLRAQTRAFHDQPKGDSNVITDQVRVVVKTKRLSRPSEHQLDEVSGYRIWYQPMNSYRDTGDGIPFGQLSPSKGEMIPGLYAFWATEARSGSPRLGLIKSMFVLRSQDQVEKLIELALDAGPE